MELKLKFTEIKGADSPWCMILSLDCQHDFDSDLTLDKDNALCQTVLASVMSHNVIMIDPLDYSNDVDVIEASNLEKKGILLNG